MTGRLQGKTAFVTAAAQGIGRATALAFAREGAHVVATDFDAERLHVFDGLDGITTRRLDATDADAVTVAVVASGPVDVLFNCAGFVHHGTILECSGKDWDFSMNLNVRSMYLMARAVLPGMIERRAGSIVNMASVVSSLKAAPDRFVYATSKAAVIGLTKAIAVDFVKHGVRCNAICPGTIETPSLGERIAAMGDAATARRDFIARQPMGRLGRPEEIAALAVHLASDESAFTTGATFVADGGMAL